MNQFSAFIVATKKKFLWLIETWNLWGADFLNPEMQRIDFLFRLVSRDLNSRRLCIERRCKQVEENVYCRRWCRLTSESTKLPSQQFWFSRCCMTCVHGMLYAGMFSGGPTMTTTAAAATTSTPATTSRRSTGTTAWPTEMNRPSAVGPTAQWLKHWSVSLEDLN